MCSHLVCWSLTALCLVTLVGCERLIERQVAANVEGLRATEADLMAPERFEVVLCGTSAPFPNPSRAQACTAVFVAGKFLVFDIGDGAQESLENLQLPIQHVRAVFLTHFHSDHFADLGELIDRSWIFGRRHVLEVFGPPGVEAVVDGFLAAYRLEFGYRTAHHGERIMPSDGNGVRAVPVLPGAESPSEVVFDEDGVVVRAFLVDHAPVAPALGYTVEHGGRRLVISGDTDDTPRFREMARGADVLVSEVMNKSVVRLLSRALEENGRADQSQIMADVLDYHIDVTDLARLAEEAGVGTLVLTHLVPAVDSRLLMDWLFEGHIEEHFGGALVIGSDGTRVRVGP